MSLPKSDFAFCGLGLTIFGPAHRIPKIVTSVAEQLPVSLSLTLRWVRRVGRLAQNLETRFNIRP